MFARRALQGVLRHQQKGAGASVFRGVVHLPSTARSFCAPTDGGENVSPLQESLDMSEGSLDTPASEEALSYSEESLDTPASDPEHEPHPEDTKAWLKMDKKDVVVVKPRMYYTPEEAVALVLEKRVPRQRRFVESVDVAINLKVDPRKVDQIVRGTAILPHGNGNDVRVMVFARGDKAQEALDAGADFVGAEDMIEKIQGGFTDFDRTIATPDMMGLVGKVARKLGPRQLMPNPKMGTITSDPATAVKLIKSGQVKFKVEKAGILHVCIAKKNFTPEKILDNLKNLMYAVSALRPEVIKGVYIKNVSLSTTMGPSFRINVFEIDPSSSRFKA